MEVVKLAAAGRPDKAIGAELFISSHTVSNHLKSIYRKTGVHSRAQLARYAIRRSIVDPD